MNSSNVVIVNKKLGETPLAAIKRLQKANKLPTAKKIAYAGRLDPMAQGLLLLLVEPETKNRAYYQKLDKIYEFEILFGVQTDTYDILGLPSESKINPQATVNKAKLTETIRSFMGKQKQKYPPYSSVSVNGKPLWWWARQNKLSQITIPEKTIELYTLKVLKTGKVASKTIEKTIKKRLAKVQGDFRQERILAAWKSLFASRQNATFTTALLCAKVSSGTYVRQLVVDIGNDMGVPTCTLSIKRTQVGPYKLSKNAG